MTMEGMPNSSSAAWTSAMTALVRVSMATSEKLVVSSVMRRASQRSSVSSGSSPEALMISTAGWISGANSFSVVNVFAAIPSGGSLKTWFTAVRISGRLRQLSWSSSMTLPLSFEIGAIFGE